MELAGRFFEMMGVNPSLPIQDKINQSIIPLASYTTLPMFGLNILDNSLKARTGTGVAEGTEMMYGKPRFINSPKVNYMPGMGAQGYGGAF